MDIHNYGVLASFPLHFPCKTSEIVKKIGRPEVGVIVRGNPWRYTEKHGNMAGIPGFPRTSMNFHVVQYGRHGRND